jgi:excinuclease UvrABC nuclease subunit
LSAALAVLVAMAAGCVQPPPPRPAWRFLKRPQARIAIIPASNRTDKAGAPIVLDKFSPLLHLVQSIRDEAHRFAVAGHRRKRARRHNESVLETIPGLGPVKRRELLKQFGGLQGILRAGVDDFVQVRGLGRNLAEVIYEHLHPGS